ncbi:hypothetical protein DFP72DRAFT_517434 [Ephemerocybe angulata]|uniref:Secreted protein n=1 Tax=Ephemerocybe angulata TaxID=980116 RepID=A0A8H6M0P3_9AGAR|nr:hypothetical protein DFP72DRAFT_517434 [Tulosesus angulatus]
MPSYHLFIFWVLFRATVMRVLPGVHSCYCEHMLVIRCSTVKRRQCVERQGRVRRSGTKGDEWLSITVTRRRPIHPIDNPASFFNPCGRRHTPSSSLALPSPRSSPCSTPHRHLPILAIHRHPGKSSCSPWCLRPTHAVRFKPAVRPPMAAHSSIPIIVASRLSPPSTTRHDHL